MNPRHQRVYRSKWVFPVDQPPIENGMVVVSNRTIEEVGQFNSVSHSASDVVDLGEGALIPGLVNAHTHLEFSKLEKPLGEPGIRFTDWIRLIVGCRSKANENATPKTSSIQRGLNESFESGVWTIGEIATAPFLLKDYLLPEEMQMAIFLEQLGREDSTFEHKRTELDSFLRGDSTSDSGSESSDFKFCASPHTPYSVHPKLLEQICDQARIQNRAVAMHVAETREELDLLRNRTGDFVDLLKDFGVWKPETFDEQCSILKTLKTLAQVPRSLIIHGNYLNGQELDFVASQAKTMSVVFCPRTHNYFGHEDYPLNQMRRRNINVAVGTDSRASNPDLRLYEELKFIANHFPELPVEEILKMGTEFGAQALGCIDRLGSITVGKRAALSFIEPDESMLDANPADWIFAENSICRPIVGSGSYY